MECRAGDGEGEALTTETENEGEYEVVQGDRGWRMTRRQVMKDEFALPPPDARTGNEETGWEWAWDFV